LNIDQALYFKPCQRVFERRPADLKQIFQFIQVEPLPWHELVLQDTLPQHIINCVIQVRDYQGV
jgi:hypothetical protein